MQEPKNKAADNFEGKDLSNLKNAYDNSTLIFLLHLQDVSHCLKCVLNTDESSDAYISEIWSLNILSAQLNCPAIFICPQYSELSCTDYFVGVIYQSQLLVINPTGDEISDAFHDLLSAIFEISKSECFFRRHFFSTNDVLSGFDNINESGPLCVELVRALSADLQRLISEFESWSRLAIESDGEKSDEMCIEVDTRGIVKSDMLKIPKEDGISELMKNIRGFHYKELETMPSLRLKGAENGDQPSIEIQNQYLMDKILNAPEQVLVRCIVNGEINEESLEKHPNFLLLQQRLKSHTADASKDFYDTDGDFGEEISRMLCDLGFDADPSPVGEQRNKASEEFIVNGLKNYHKAYGFNTVVHLVHVYPLSDCLRYVVRSVKQDLFIKQLYHLNCLSNQFSIPAIFIMPESDNLESEKNYIVGVIFKNQLLLINPIGELISKEIADILSLVVSECSDHHIFNRIYLSTNIIQKDVEHKSSRGPICVEILLVLTSTLDTICEAFEEWSSLESEKARKKERMVYYPVSCDRILFEYLRNIEVENVVEEMVNIRSRHFKDIEEELPQQLIKRGLDNPSVEDQNRYIDEEVIKASEQVLIWELSQMEISLETPALRRVYQSLESRLANRPVQRDLTTDDQYAIESKVLQMCESMIMLCGFIKPVINWFNDELLEYFHTLFSINTSVIRNELHPQTAFSEKEEERRCSILFELLNSKEHELYKTYTYIPALKEQYDFSDKKEREIFLETKIHYKSVKRDKICFADPEDAQSLNELLGADDSEILVHLVGYKEPGIKSGLPCSYKSALEDFVQVLIKFVSFNSVDFDLKLEGIQFTLNLARCIISLLDDLRSIIKRDCFFISNKLPLLRQFESFGERFYYCLMTELENNVANAKESTIYISQDGNYCVRDQEGVLHQDILPVEIIGDIKNLKEQLCDRNFTLRLLRVISSRNQIRSPRVLETVNGVNRLMYELNLWFSGDEVYEELRGVFIQHKVPNPNTTSQSLLDRVEVAFDYDASLRTSITQWTEFHQILCKMHNLKQAIDPRRIIDTQKLRIIRTMENARSTLETFIGPIHNALFAEPNVNYRTCQNNLRHGASIPHSLSYDLKMQRQLQKLNLAQPHGSSSAISPRSSPPSTPKSPRKQGLPRPDSPSILPPFGKSPQRRTSSTPPPVSPRFSAVKTFVGSGLVSSPPYIDKESSDHNIDKGGST